MQGRRPQSARRTMARNVQHAACSMHHTAFTHHAPHGWAGLLVRPGLRTAAKKRRTIGEADLDERCVEYLQSVSDEVAAIGACLRAYI